MQIKLEKYFDRLFPICRSITGNGVRETLRILQEIIPLQLHEVPTGKKVFDWEIPKEWNIRDAYIITPNGEKICSFKKNNLHVVSYSIPIKKELDFEELNKHLHTLPDLPDAIPYLTSYYKEYWGFCLAHNEYLKLPKEGKYQVVIDAELENGHLTYGNLVLKGESDEEVLFSTYICHPSMANNELSGPLVTAFLYQKIASFKNRRFTYRFVFAPETIGVIAYLNQHGFHLKEKLKAGYVVTCVGDTGDYTYKRSKKENSLSDRIAENVLTHSNKKYKIINFDIGGSDERQYCSPGFNLPVGSLMRTMYKQYKEYHTSLDNKDFISFDAMQETIETYLDIVKAIELNDFYLNTVPYCEPQLGKRGLYLDNTAQKKMTVNLADMLYLLSYADGELDLLSIAEKRDKSILDFEDIVSTLKEHKLLVHQTNTCK